jgi:hypothetical protein
MQRRRLAVVSVVAVVLGTSASLGAAPASAEPDLPPRGTVWFGPSLDWSNDSAAAYQRRLGAEASLVGGSIGYPLTPTSQVLLEDLSRQSAGVGAVAVVTLEPKTLTGLTQDDAESLASTLGAATARDGSFLIVRFAPEMNGSWAPWGQQPLAYIDAFRAVAEAVHDSTDAARMLWAPSYGGGYPFSDAVNSTTTLVNEAPPIDAETLPYLDTDGDGEVTSLDDPYGPYYPGDDFVDWVGLTMLRYGVAPTFGANSYPEAGELDDRFKERFGYDDDSRRSTFYVRFAGQRKKPFLLTTGAMHQTGAEGSTEGVLKRAWLRQVVGAVASRPRLKAVQWLEEVRAEPAVGGTTSSQLTDDPALASTSRAVLDQGAIAFGPLDGIGTGSADASTSDQPALNADEQADGDGSGERSGGGWASFFGGVLTALAVVLVGGVVALQVRRRRLVPPWLR